MIQRKGAIRNDRATKIETLSILWRDSAPVSAYGLLQSGMPKYRMPEQINGKRKQEGHNHRMEYKAKAKQVRNLCRPIQLNAVNIYDTYKLSTTREVIIFF